MRRESHFPKLRPVSDDAGLFVVKNLNEESMIQFFAALGSILVAAVWGFAFVVVKDSLASVSATYICAMRFSIAAIILGLLFFKRIRRMKIDTLKKSAVIGVFLFLAYFFQTVGCNYTTPGKNAFFTTGYVILMPFFGWLVYKARPAWFVFFAAVLQIAGIGFLSLGSDIKKGISLTLGDWLTLLGSVFYCLQMFYQGFFSKKDRESDPFVYAFVQFALCAVLNWIISPFYNAESNSFTLQIQRFPLEAFRNGHFVVSIIYLGFFSTALAFVLLNIGFKYLDFTLATILFSFESVFGMFFSVLIPVNGAKENLSVWGVIGCVLIFIAVLLAQIKKGSSCLRFRSFCNIIFRKWTTKTP